MSRLWAKNLRISLELTQKELAEIAKVPPKAVDLLEHNRPLPLDDKRKILTKLYALKKSANLGKLHPFTQEVQTKYSDS